MNRLIFAALFLCACSTEWHGAELALACTFDGHNTEYLPLACSGDVRVLGSIDHGHIVLADGTVCLVRDVALLEPGEEAFTPDR